MSLFQIVFIAGATLLAAVAAGLVTNAIAGQVRRLTPRGRHLATEAAVVAAFIAGSLVVIAQGAPGSTQAAVPAAPSTLRDKTGTTPITPSSTPQPTQPRDETPEPVASPSSDTADTAIDHFVVGTGYATPAVPCCRVGPNTFQLQSSGKTSFGYNWSARTADNTIVDSDDCAIIVTITGPEDVPGIRKSDCTVTGSNGFSDFGNIASVSTPGTYTVIVRDDVSHASGTIKVQVVQ